MKTQPAPSFDIRPLDPADRDRVRELIVRRWGVDTVVAHDTIYHPCDLAGFVAHRGDEWLGLLTYHLEGCQCEIVTLDSLCPSSGIGTALIQTIRQAATQAGCKRLWLITTNDNLNALRFYQKRGFALVVIHRNAIERARRLKPDIPMVGDEGIPLRDEIELEITLE
ncbi:MAG: GNAT family N-acetyltransferase [Anaerolineae bacterium]|nr:GNAT family N-acetyltransferase [Anaerolineae bacterium]